MKRFFSFMKKKDVVLLGFGALCLMMQVLFDFISPRYMSEMTENSSKMAAGVIEKGDVYYSQFMMLLCILGSLFFSILAVFFVTKVAASFLADIRLLMFKRIQLFSSKEINDLSLSSLITRMTIDVKTVQGDFITIFQSLIKVPVIIIWAVISINRLGFRWSFIIIVTVLILSIIVALVLRAAVPFFIKIPKINDSLNNELLSKLLGTESLRAYNSNSLQNDILDRVNAEFVKENTNGQLTMAIMVPLINLIMNIMTATVFLVAADVFCFDPSYKMHEGVGQIMAFVPYSMQIGIAFMLVVELVQRFPRFNEAILRMIEVIDKEIYFDKAPINKSKENPPKKPGSVEFKNVCFSYNEGGKNFINNISFDIKPGETMAIVGGIGSGKTTIINLLMRFFDPSSGLVLINGIDARDYGKKELYKSFGFVPQKAVLFSDTIEHNIVYGDNEIDGKSMLQEVVYSAVLDDVLNHNGRDMSSHIAENGKNFSGGQKQRLSIARALARDCDILVMDDPFSALDFITAKELKNRIFEKYAKKTKIVVSQRIAPIMDADKILVLDKGEEVGLGFHDELIDNCKVYKEIYLSQVR